VLKTDNLPEEASSELLQELFSKFEGFQEVRYAAAKHVAFIEFAGTEQAKVAREGLKGHQLTETHRLRVNFAKQ
jgi:U2 small nuclear ribonucleoprotein B''